MTGNELKMSSKGRGKAVALLAAIVIAGAGAAILFWAKGQGASRPETASGSEKAVALTHRAPAKRFKILHVMSYHSPWMWTDSQFNGFKDALKGLDVEYKVFQMDTKRHSSREWKEKVGGEARMLIDAWKPDLVFTSDDNAQEYVTRHYLNGQIPFVFCAVNRDPGDYGFVGSRNVTGVLERVHYVQTMRLLKEIVPAVRKVAIITDPSEIWRPMMERMKRLERQFGDVKVVSYDVLETYEQYKQKVKAYEGKVDALGFLGIFCFKDADGVNVLYQEVSRWTVENSPLPDFTFWEDRVGHGTLCAVTASGFAQGRAAGRIARGILVEGRSPASYPMKATAKGQPVINLARAGKLGLNITSSLLLTAEIITKFDWDTK